MNMLIWQCWHAGCFGDWLTGSCWGKLDKIRALITILQPCMQEEGLKTIRLGTLLSSTPEQCSHVLQQSEKKVTA
jgi:hypothetical protein